MKFIVHIEIDHTGFDICISYIKSDIFLFIRLVLEQNHIFIFICHSHGVLLLSRELCTGARYLLSHLNHVHVVANVI